MKFIKEDGVKGYVEYSGITPEEAANKFKKCKVVGKSNLNVQIFGDVKEVKSIAKDINTSVAFKKK